MGQISFGWQVSDSKHELRLGSELSIDYLRTCIQILNRTTGNLSHADVSPTVEIAYPWLGMRMNKGISPCPEPWQCMGVARRTSKKVVAARAWWWLLVCEIVMVRWRKVVRGHYLRNNIGMVTQPTIIDNSSFLKKIVVYLKIIKWTFQ